MAWKPWQEIGSDLRNQASKNGRISKLLVDKTLEALCGAKGGMGLLWVLENCECPAAFVSPPRDPPQRGGG